MQPVSRRSFVLGAVGALASVVGVAAGAEALISGGRGTVAARATPGAGSGTAASASPAGGALSPSAAALGSPTPLASATPAPPATPAFPGPAGPAPSDAFALHVPVLMYHRVTPMAAAGDSLPGLVVPPDLFAAQLGALRAAGWRSITVADLARALEAGQPVPPRTLAVSLDDGWDDGYVHALPALQAIGYRATYYVIGRRIGIPRFLSAPQLQAMAAAGMEIGDHTFDHVELPYLPADRQRYEIEAAAGRIGDTVGVAPVTFSYPSGRFDPAVEEMVRAAGLRLAVTTEEGAQQRWSDRFAVPRVRVSPSMDPATLLKTVEPYA